ncbi:DNA-binding protein [Haloferax mediterranei ATCC 33500]|uniref:DNA binding domain-containing protein n=1 Tax=Haloferax mediterranei (strain ATCC 33500 / DSM 1411 / JCM 8866 / NBRC 14739 / NCIMB 2177 / R-4) TaxID=523841 RepID=I3R5T0_HALMT|nr:bacterio-opsin activator domain-containing protein [Haloferax mediterranei]AFK19590.1 DNA binding domain-containing protein [Haloferax mediterranei ATCC 33500]AHZ22982.1 DNA-binding protein [Haloferax mediterranei ATCC 33500]ELZ99909.1 DNA binding domain-containing protein [Haloferax mediterranei ATCC 33500]MDX5987669.1 bacterio-opsin activator domain-containing protein [Haloferax mediterranei ATCC 33500]QCQ74153.1 DNA-binding protein [Haloferax mediterranei ATCC 33500]
MTDDHTYGYEVELGHSLDDSCLSPAFDDSELEITFMGCVPVSGEPVPYFFARGAGSDAVADLLETHAGVKDFEVVSDSPEGRLYRCEWMLRDDGLISTIQECRGIVREIVGTKHGWTLSVYFPTNEQTTRFHDTCLERDIDIDVRRVESSRLDERRYPNSNLSEKQLAALKLAFTRGYFETPKETTLSDIAANLEISEQALSQRLRRGLRHLVGSAVEDLEDDSLSPK